MSCLKLLIILETFSESELISWKKVSVGTYGVCQLETKEKKEAMSKLPLMRGIDVSKWQGKPDWKKIASDGVEESVVIFAF